MITVHFEDQGQDFLAWDIDEKNIVVGCRPPCQAYLWVGSKIMNRVIKPGFYLRFKSEKIKAHGSGGAVVLKYKVISIEPGGNHAV